MRDIGEIISLLFRDGIDYLYLVYGFCFILLAMVCFFLQKRDVVQWRWLAFMGIFHACGDFLTLWQIDMGRSDFLVRIQVYLLFFSFLCLIEFGRSILVEKFRRLGFWVYFPSVAVFFGAVYFGLSSSSLTGIVRIFVALPSFIFFSGALWLLSDGSRKKDIKMRVFAVIAFFYGFSGAIVVPEGGVIGGIGVSEDAFVESLGIPVILFRILVCLLLVLGIWHYYVTRMLPSGREVSARFRNSYLVLAYLLLIIFAAGWYVVKYVDRSVDRYLREDFREKAVLAATRFDPEELRMLKGGMEDLDTPLYRGLQCKLTEIFEASQGCSYVYIMGYRHGNVFYLVDSGQDCEMPGETYPEATPELVNCFYNAASFVEGPVSDEWGVWVSAIAPIIDYEQEKVIGVLGIDIDYMRWRGLLGRIRFLPLAIVLLFAAMLVFYYIFVLVQKEALAVVRSSKQRFEDIAGITADCLWEIDIKGVFSFISERSADVFGVGAEELIGKTLQEFLCEGEIERIRRNLKTLVEKKEGFQDLELRCRHRDGHEVFLLSSGVPIINDHGKVTGFRGGFRDVSERRRVEAEQKKLEAELQQSRKMEAIGTLAAGIAHEINTPIQFVGDNVYFLGSAVKDLLDASDACRKYIEEAEKNNTDPLEFVKVWKEQYRKIDSEYLSKEIPQAQAQLKEGLLSVNRIIGAMKDFSHMSMDEKILSDINRAVESTVIVCRNTWKYVADMEMDLQMDLPMAACFISDIKQVLMNVIINAAHAIADVVGADGTSKGRIRVVTRYEEGEDSVLISVSDTGKGIPEKVRSKVFDPFFTTKDVGKGTGQGLAISYKVVEKHGGKIWFETETGKGTTFFIRLPLSVDDASGRFRA